MFASRCLGMFRYRGFHSSCHHLRPVMQAGHKRQREEDKGEKTWTPTVITFVTGNAKKLEEVKRILQPDTSKESTSYYEYELTHRKIDLPELQGEPIAIAREKCLAAAEKVQGAVITEDTSLCFNALKSLPGPYIKWFLESCGHDGLNKMIAAFEDKTAYAQTVVAFCPGPGHAPILFDGRTTGKIVAARGKLDFGWDPIFEPDEGQGKTYAEMTKEEKDSISHRSRAFKQLSDYMNKFRNDIALSWV
jgi:inosine triphosphate pyrophosphatase